MLQHNIKNSYFRSPSVTKSHNNETYETRFPTYLNDFSSENDPRFYDCPRSHQPQHTLRKAYTNSEISGTTIKEEKKSVSIIRMGTCGSLQGEVGVNELVAGTHGLGIDNVLHFYTQENNEEEKAILAAFEKHTSIHTHKIQPYISSASKNLIQHFNEGYSKGITVTCPGFYGPQGRILRLPLKMPQLVDQMTSFRFEQHRIANFEMETSAIYGLCNLLGHQCLSINVIIANRVKKEYSKDMGKAVDHMIQKSLGIIATI